MIEIKVPTVGESITEVTIASWTRNEGDYVEMDDVIAELESDKATFELSAEKSGVLHIVVEEGEDVNVGDLICKIDETAPKPEKVSGSSTEAKTTEVTVTKEESASQPENASAATENSTHYAAGHSSPAASKLISENNLDSASISGTGKDGRITKGDVLQALNSEQSSQTNDVTAQKAYTMPAGNFSREERTEKMSRLRQTISRRLVEVKNQTAMLTTFNDVDMSKIMQTRKLYKEKFKAKHGVNLGFMSFFTKACCIALRAWPAVNSKIDGANLIYHDFCDISIAVSTPKGLLVPVIRNAESLSMAGVEKAIVDLASRARDNKLGLEEMTGGTFTITNGGVFGSLLSTPIINGDQAAILGMHRIEERPVAINGEVQIRPMMYLALSYDHRIIDGKESVSFLKMVKHLLEDPAMLFAEGDPVKKLLDI